MDRDWEPLLYAKMFDYDILPSLPSFTRVTVEGTVHMVIYIHVFKKLLLFIIIMYRFKFELKIIIIYIL